MLTTAVSVRRSSPLALLASAGIHLLAVGCLFLLAPGITDFQVKRQHTALVLTPVELPAPALEPPPAQPGKPLVIPEPAPLAAPVLPAEPPPIPINPEPQRAEAPEIALPDAAPPPPPDTPDAEEPRPAATEVFARQSPASPAAPKPDAGVETGSFDEVQSSAAAATAAPRTRLGGFSTSEPASLSRIVYRTTKPAVGAFGSASQGVVQNRSADGSPSPAGPVFGRVSNGGGPSAAPSGPASAREAGFGGPTPGSPQSARSGAAPVRTSGFGTVVAKPTTRTNGHDPRAETRQTPLEVLTKPRPDYTAESRRLKVEGEVVLEVLFRSSGEVEVLRVIEGLGHGLDENACRAAESMSFRPATHDGRPVDTKAVVRIQFQLAY